MNRADVRKCLTSIFRDVFDDDALVIDDTITAKDVDGWDSLSNIDLVVAVEKAFGINLSVREIKGFKNVGDLITLVCERSG
jgi:acyl carrier protein